MRAITCQSLEMVGLMKPFDLDIFYGERVAVLGSNGSGKSQFLRLLAGDPTVESRGSWKLGARVVPGYFVQTHHHPELLGRTPHEILERDRGETMSALRRYELHRQADQPFETLSGGAEALQDSLAGYQGTVLCVPRPLVCSLVRPVLGLRPRRRGVRAPRTGLGRIPGGSPALNGPWSCRRRRPRLAPPLPPQRRE